MKDKYKYDLMAVCQDLHMNHSGASDSFLCEPRGFREKLIAFLRERLDNWTPSVPSFKAYDDAVKAVVEATLAECENDRGNQ